LCVLGLEKTRHFLFPELRHVVPFCLLFDIMQESELITQLQSQLAHLERHVLEQDTEFYQLAKRVDALNKLVQLQRAQLSALASETVPGAGDMPANEKPPHY
jgi:uncharacterized coiled-coil protein SlyX